MSENKLQHPYHLVEPSPWPVVGAVAALLLAVGAIMYMHAIDKGFVLAIGVIAVIATMYFWWKDVIKEGEHEGHHTPTVQLGLRYGMTEVIVLHCGLGSYSREQSGIYRRRMASRRCGSF